MGIRLRNRSLKAPIESRELLEDGRSGASTGPLAQKVSQRRFLKMLVAGAGLAGLAGLERVSSEPRKVYAQTINDDLTVTGTLTVQGTGNSSFAGNLGLGTTSPGTALQVLRPRDLDKGLVKLQASGHDQAGLSLWVAPSGQDPSSRNWMIANNYKAYGNLDVLRSTSYSGNPTTSALAVSGSGDLGVGLENPMYKLDVAGEVAINHTVVIDSSYTAKQSYYAP